jgi:hypothetical protein
MNAATIVLRVLAGIIVLLVIAAGVLIWYVSPQEQLNVAYTEVDFDQKIRSMIKTGNAQMMLSEWEINQFMKQWLYDHRQVSEEIEITGLRSEVQKEQLKLILNLKVYNTLRIGAVLQYRMEWKPPNLVAALEQANIRNFKIPPEQIPLKEIVFPVATQLPDWMKIEEIFFDYGRIWINFELDREYIEQNLL